MVAILYTEERMGASYYLNSMSISISVPYSRGITYHT